MTKLITFVVPCFNSEEYMEHCVNTILTGGTDIEIIIVDDGSTDRTGAIADDYAKKYPGIVKVIHQNNGGHGEAVNSGLRHATGLYYKVVDSDDWLDADSLKTVMAKISKFASTTNSPDIIICNYVYEHVGFEKVYIVNFANAFPVDRIFNWSNMRRLGMAQHLIMHALIYKTTLLKDCKLVLPKHTFYVDNIIAFLPLAHAKTLYYLHVNLYRYFIGRQDQSVNEVVMIKRIDQHIRVVKILIDSYLTISEFPSKKIEKYLRRYLATMLMVASVLLQLSGTDENLAKHYELWYYLKYKNKHLYIQLRIHPFGIVSYLPQRLGRKITKCLYNLVKKTYRFN